MYPNGMAVMSENVYTWTDNAQMIRDLLAELSPHLTEAEQMLFKFAICEENFNPETDEDKLYWVSKFLGNCELVGQEKDFNP